MVTKQRGCKAIIKAIFSVNNMHEEFDKKSEKMKIN